MTNNQLNFIAAIATALAIGSVLFGSSIAEAAPTTHSQVECKIGYTFLIVSASSKYVTTVDVIQIYHENDKGISVPVRC